MWPFKKKQETRITPFNLEEYVKSDRYRESHLTDDEYLSLLKKLRNSLESNPEIIGYDCTAVGCKNSECNIGLCNEEFKIKPHRRENHKCPLDSREGLVKYQEICGSVFTGYDSGCFWHCKFFNKEKINIEQVKELYDKRIEKFEKEIKNG